MKWCLHMCLLSRFNDRVSCSSEEKSRWYMENIFHKLKNPISLFCFGSHICVKTRMFLCIINNDELECMTALPILHRRQVRPKEVIHL